mgnify:CR=1 FL=1
MLPRYWIDVTTVTVNVPYAWGGGTHDVDRLKITIWNTDTGQEVAEFANDGSTFHMRDIANSQLRLMAADKVRELLAQPPDEE